MAYTRRQWKGNVKALLHFDYAYPGEVGDGLRDEIGIETWSRVGSPKWVGVEDPVDQVVVGAPMFGWRCPQFSGSGCYIKGINTQNIWNLSSDGNYEIEFFIRVTNSVAGNIFALRNISGDLFALAKNSSNQITLTSTFWGINGVATKALKTDFFHHVMVRIFNKVVQVFLDSEQIITHNLSVTEILDVIEVRLGEFVGQMDEFAFRHSAKMSTPVVPTEPYNAYLDMRLLGGAGDGVHGDITIASGTQQINTYGMISAVSPSGTDLTIGITSNGIYGGFERGNEVLIHVSTKKGSVEDDIGKYALRRVIDMRGTVIVVDKPVIDEMSLNSSLLSNYYVQIISVPNYNNLTVGAASTIIPARWDIKYGGGIVAIKCKKNMMLNGKIVTSGYMDDKKHNTTVCHAKLVECFSIGSGGGVFSVIGGLFTSTSASRMGALHSGDGLGGEGGKGGDGSKIGSSPGKNGIEGVGGGAGYGGGGGGGGGGGCYPMYQLQYDGFAGQTGNNGTVAIGGRGGNSGGNEAGNQSCKPNLGITGGKVGLSGGNFHLGDASNVISYAGSSVLIFARKIAVESSSVSTGGCGGRAGVGGLQYAGSAGLGGGGTGFAYLAIGRDA